MICLSQRTWTSTMRLSSFMGRLSGPVSISTQDAVQSLQIYQQSNLLQHFSFRSRRKAASGEQSIMYFPTPASLRQILQRERRFAIHQFAHHLPVNPISTPLALPQQDVTRLPIDGDHIHLDTAAPMASNCFGGKRQPASLSLYSHPLPGEVFKGRAPYEST